MPESETAAVPLLLRYICHCAVDGRLDELRRLLVAGAAHSAPCSRHKWTRMVASSRLAVPHSLHTTAP